MGDRVAVRVTVLDEHADQARGIFENGCDADSDDSNDGFTRFEFSEVNYGNLGVENALQEAGIPYDKHWQQGGEFNEGNEYHRVTDAGESTTIEVYIDDQNPDLSKLMTVIDSPDELRVAIIEHHAAVTPLPWTDQSRNAKRFQARKLIAS